ncbi:phosphoadenosine phosphosulfate reductase family protein [Edaphobacter modestus]|uniref:phosphoadenosine phosphosulfate reductase domain-containing protein n=1 Tax=Edaphobacter modestus TaxID=388466 RepID=UPI00102CAB4D|nr:phosphoadenosine phosphosulfate reductase family protein [Edaphobacter modestus]
MPIISVTGIRRQESTARSRMPIAADDPRLIRKGYQGAVWNPIIDWRIEQVFATIKEAGLELHEAYTRYGVSRVSCCFCIMSSTQDLAASATCGDNQAVYVAMVELEADSAFAFQGGRWLADVAPHLLPASLVDRIAKAKELAAARNAIEAEIPEHLLYTKGWPTIMPIPEEAELIASVRKRISAMFGLNAGYLSGESVLSRYAELADMKNSKEKVQ